AARQLRVREVWQPAPRHGLPDARHRGRGRVARKKHAATLLAEAGSGNATHPGKHLAGHHGKRPRGPPAGLAQRRTSQATSWDDAVSPSSLGSSLLPTTVKFIPICTDTMVPPTSIVVLPFRYHPREPMENSFTSARMGGWPLIDPGSGLAFFRNSGRVMGQLVFLAMGTSWLAAWAWGVTITAASYHAPVGRRQGGLPGGHIFPGFPGSVCLRSRYN